MGGEGWGGGGEVEGERVGRWRWQGGCLMGLERGGGGGGLGGGGVWLQ